MTSQYGTLVTVATVVDEIEGQLLVNLLNQHGIPATATGGFTSQFRAEAPGAIRVMVKQDSLLAAKSIVAEREPSGPYSEPVVEDTESSAYQPWLTRFGIWSLLIGNLLAIVGILVFWGLRGKVAVGLVGLIVVGALVAAILTRRWSVTH